jgi:hypothetical protein
VFEDVVYIDHLFGKFQNLTDAGASAMPVGSSEDG